LHLILVQQSLLIWQRCRLMTSCIVRSIEVSWIGLTLLNREHLQKLAEQGN